MLFTINVTFLYETGPIQLIFSQHYGHYWLGASAPGHQYPQCWVRLHASISALKYRGLMENTWIIAWWRHQMETLSPLLALFTGELPAPRPVTRNFDVFFDLRLNKRLGKQSWCWWFETPSRSLWRHCNGLFGWCHVTCSVQIHRKLTCCQWKLK